MYMFLENGIPCIIKTSSDVSNGIRGNYKHFHIPNVFDQNKSNTYKRFKTDSLFRDAFVKKAFNNKK